MAQVDWQQWFEKIWEEREERLYRQFFGDLGPGIFNLPASMFESLGVPAGEVDPRFLFHGVFECPPNEKRDHWVYVSSGMSNAWGDSPETVSAERYSGLGFELTVHSRQQAKWPLRLLHWVMAVQLLTAAGLMKGELIQRNDRIPLGGALGKKDGELTQVLVTTGEGYPEEFVIGSGKVELLMLLGITGREAEFARTQGAEGLIALLRHHEVYPVTDPGRLGAV